MPNHVLNEIVFSTVDAEQQASILAKCYGKEGKVDFNTLVPMPLNIWRGNIGVEHDKAFGLTWWNWASENWGTKWNAYDHKPTVQTATSLTLVFETAWSPPYPWLAALLNSTELPFDHNWLDEGASWSRSGRFSIREGWGPEWKDVEADEATHRRIHMLHWGCERFEDEEA